MASDDRDRLLGIWRLLAAQLHDEDSGAVFDSHGPDPLGYVIFSAQGRVSFILAASGRKPPASDADMVELFRDLVAYSGRFTVAGDQIVTEVDVAWNPLWDNTRQPRTFRLDGDRLTLMTGVTSQHPNFPGRRVRGTITWVRDSPSVD